MKQPLTSAPLGADLVALKLHAERAGLAWACPFSSSDEFEAAVISARRRAGAYGPRRRRHYMLYAVLAAGALAVALGFFV